VELKRIPDIQETIKAMLLYGERHFVRMDRLLQKSYLIDHSLHAMHPAGQDLFADDSDEGNDVFPVSHQLTFKDASLASAAASTGLALVPVDLATPPAPDQGKKRRRSAH